MGWAERRPVGRGVGSAISWPCLVFERFALSRSSPLSRVPHFHPGTPGTRRRSRDVQPMTFRSLSAITPSAALFAFGLLAAAPTVQASNLLTNVAEAGQYQLVYELSIPTSAAWNSSAIPYLINNSATIGAGAFERIAYYLELTSGAGTQWAYVSVNAFTDQANRIGVPIQASGGFYSFGTMSSAWSPNANIFSNVAGVANGTGIGTVNLEFWSGDSGTANTAGVPGASAGTFDFGDTPAGGGYGSMQIHNYGTGRTVLSLNGWGAGVSALDLGIGNQNTGSPDWTLAHNAGDYSTRTLQVLVQPIPEPSTFGVVLGGAAAGLAWWRRRKTA